MSGGVLLFLLPGLHSLWLKSPPCAPCWQVDIFAGSYALGLKRFPVYFFRIKPVFRLFRRFFRIADGNDCYREHRFWHTELFTQVVNDHRHRRRTAKTGAQPFGMAGQQQVLRSEGTVNLGIVPSLFFAVETFFFVCADNNSACCIFGKRCPRLNLSTSRNSSKRV